MGSGLSDIFLDKRLPWAKPQGSLQPIATGSGLRVVSMNLPTIQPGLLEIFSRAKRISSSSLF